MRIEPIKNPAFEPDFLLWSMPDHSKFSNLQIFKLFISFLVIGHELRESDIRKWVLQ